MALLKFGLASQNSVKLKINTCTCKMKLLTAILQKKVGICIVQMDPLICLKSELLSLKPQSFTQGRLIYVGEL